MSSVSSARMPSAMLTTTFCCSLERASKRNCVCLSICLPVNYVLVSCSCVLIARILIASSSSSPPPLFLIYSTSHATPTQTNNSLKLNQRKIMMAATQSNDSNTNDDTNAGQLLQMSDPHNLAEHQLNSMLCAEHKLLPLNRWPFSTIQIIHLVNDATVTQQSTFKPPPVRCLLLLLLIESNQMERKLKLLINDETTNSNYNYVVGSLNEQTFKFAQSIKTLLANITRCQTTTTTINPTMNDENNNNDRACTNAKHNNEFEWPASFIQLLDSLAQKQRSLVAQLPPASITTTISSSISSLAIDGRDFELIALPLPTPFIILDANLPRPTR